jgi:alcohol dehydrogenase class IV
VRFTIDAAQPRVVFGAGSLASLPAEMDRLGARRILIVSTRGRSELLQRVAGLLGERVAGTFDEAVVHVPEAVASRAIIAAATAHADSVLSVGGGSPIGVAKAIALATLLPIVAVPTTYSGSEMTSLWGLTRGGVKHTGRDARVQARTVLYDPELTVELPQSVSGASGMNAIAHCVEALYAPDANPVTSWMAEEGIRALGESLSMIVDTPGDIEARTRAMYGAWLAGASLAAVQMGLHHKLAHVLGGSFDLPHAETHAVLLPYTAEYNAPAAADAMSRVARALGGSSAPVALYDLGRRLRVPVSLRDVGMKEPDLDRAADLAIERPYANPARVTREGVLSILRRAFAGQRVV